MNALTAARGLQQARSRGLGERPRRSGDARVEQREQLRRRGMVRDGAQFVERALVVDLDLALGRLPGTEVVEGLAQTCSMSSGIRTHDPLVDWKAAVLELVIASSVTTCPGCSDSRTVSAFGAAVPSSAMRSLSGVASARWWGGHRQYARRTGFLGLTGPRVLVKDLAEVERELILRTLQLAGGNQSRAAKMLNISRKKLHDASVRYGLP